MNSVFLLKILCFVFKGSLNIPEYRCLLIGRVQYLYTIEHAVENIAYFILISVTLLSLGKSNPEVKICKKYDQGRVTFFPGVWDLLLHIDFYIF